MTTRKERVDRAVAFRHPERVPIVFWNRDPTEGDVMNISQPNVVDLEYVGSRMRGRQCFLMPISCQTVSIQGTRQEILAEARRMYEMLGTPSGGFIGYVEEYGCMGMSESNYRACGEAFRRLTT